MENNVWRIRYNVELNTLLKEENIVRFIKSQRIRWLGHVERMEDNAMPKRMLKGRLYSQRRKGRPRMRWLDDVESDFFFLICTVGCGIKVHSTLRPLNGLLCQPRVIMIMEKSV
jgi:hypothetical protein